MYNNNNQSSSSSSFSLSDMDRWIADCNNNATATTPSSPAASSGLSPLAQRLAYETDIILRYVHEMAFGSGNKKDDNNNNNSTSCCGVSPSEPNSPIHRPSCNDGDLTTPFTNSSSRRNSSVNFGFSNSGGCFTLHNGSNNSNNSNPNSSSLSLDEMAQQRLFVQTLLKNCDERARNRFEQASPEVQQLVLVEGPIKDARNDSAVLIRRVQSAEKRLVSQGKANAAVWGGAWGGNSNSGGLKRNNHFHNQHQHNHHHNHHNHHHRFNMLPLSHLNNNNNKCSASGSSTPTAASTRSNIWFPDSSSSSSVDESAAVMAAWWDELSADVESKRRRIE